MRFALVMNRLHPIWRIASIALLTAAFSTITAGFTLAWDVNIAWDPNTESNLDGYTVYYAKNSPGPPFEYVGDLPLSNLPNPNHPSTVITSLEGNVKYYFALTAYDTDGNESSFSRNLCVSNDGQTTIDCTPAVSASFGNSSGSGSSSGCFIQSARDL